MFDFIFQCIGYIEYENAKDASTAVFKCDQATLDGSTIEVSHILTWIVITFENQIMKAFYICTICVVLIYNTKLVSIFLRFSSYLVVGLYKLHINNILLSWFRSCVES